MRARLISKPLVNGTQLGTPNREPQEYSRNIMEYKDPGRYIPIIYLLYSWGSRFVVASRFPLLVQPWTWILTHLLRVGQYCYKYMRPLQWILYRTQGWASQASKLEDSANQDLGIHPRKLGGWLTGLLRSMLLPPPGCLPPKQAYSRSISVGSCKRDHHFVAYLAPRGLGRRTPVLLSP